MSERNLNFDTVVDRRNTRSLKFDFASKRGRPDGLIPMWVADMDFPISSYIQEAIVKSAEHGIYGYTETKEEYFEIVQSWMKRRYGWNVESIDWLIKTPGIVFALGMAVKAYTNPGDAVLIQQPIYYPFSEVIEDNDRRVVSSTLVDDGSGRYQIDFADLEKKIFQENIRLFLMCNPHNPGGSVWTKEELLRMGNICRRHRVVVVSDEIHADFIWKGTHHVFAALSPEFRDISVICTAPTKTFNIAGLQISNIFIPNPELRTTFQKQMNAAGYSQANAMGILACEAAYQYGEEWLSAVRTYIYDNIQFTKHFLDTQLPEVQMFEPEGTYLIWLDFRALGLSDSELDEWIVKKAGLWLDSGSIFGKAGSGFQRINVACPRSVLQDALDHILRAVKDLRTKRYT